MSSVNAKMCIKCGTDCSGKPRTKDAQGRYTCKSCFDAAAKAAAVKPAAKAVAAVKPAAKAVAAVADDDAALMASLLESSAPSLTEMCPSCGSGMAGGAVVCTICGYNKQSGQSTGLRVSKGPSKAGAVMAGAVSVAGGLAATPLVLVLSAVGAAIGGAIGAAVWAFVAYKFNYEISWIAIGVGVLTGVGGGVAAGSRAGMFTGLVAAAIAIASVAGGKYVAASMVIDDVVTKDKDFRAAQRHQVTDEEIVSFLARDVGAELASKGKNYQWPEGVEPEHAMGEEDFPPPVWKESQARFAAMDDAAKARWRESVQTHYNEALQNAVVSFKKSGWLETFSAFDILWFSLAVIGAFSAGSGGNMSSGEDD